MNFPAAGQGKTCLPDSGGSSADAAAPEIYTRSNAAGNTKHYVNSVLLRESIPGPGSGNTLGGFR
jgi:hypothetical protein